MEEELPKCGPHTEKVKAEVEQAVELVSKRVNAVLDKKREEDEKKLEVERKKKELEEKAESLVKELDGMVGFTERGLAELRTQIEKFQEDKEALPDVVEIRWKKIQDQGEELEALVEKCQTFFREHHQEMKPPVKTKAPPSAAAKAAAKAKVLALQNGPSDDPADGCPLAETQEEKKEDLKEVTSKIVQRISVAKKDIEAESQKALGIKDEVAFRAKAFGRFEKVKSTFRKYDKAKNGLLFKRNVMAYAASEFNFEIPLDVFESFWPLHAQYSAKHGEKGVSWDNFQDLKVSIGIARELQRDAKRKALREASVDAEREEKKPRLA